MEKEEGADDERRIDIPQRPDVATMLDHEQDPSPYRPCMPGTAPIARRDRHRRAAQTRIVASAESCPVAESPSIGTTRSTDPTMSSAEMCWPHRHRLTIFDTHGAGDHGDPGEPVGLRAAERRREPATAREPRRVHAVAVKTQPVTQPVDQIADEAPVIHAFREPVGAPFGYTATKPNRSGASSKWVTACISSALLPAP